MANWGCKEKETKCGVDDGFWKLSWIQKKKPKSRAKIINAYYAVLVSPMM